MAGEGYAAMGRASRGLIKNRQNVDKWRGILADVSSVATFAAGQAKKAKTAWGEYEKGYESISGGEKIDTSKKFGERGWLKRTFGGPKGEIDIGSRTYDMKNIQKAGQFADKDVASLLGPKERMAEIKRIAGGKLIPDYYPADIDYGGTLSDATPLEPLPEETLDTSETLTQGSTLHLDTRKTKFDHLIEKQEVTGQIPPASEKTTSGGFKDTGMTIKQLVAKGKQEDIWDAEFKTKMDASVQRKKTALGPSGYGTSGYGDPNVQRNLMQSLDENNKNRKPVDNTPDWMKWD